jgi:hypothetical protein
MDDGIDLDQKDQVTRHIAACDACRTVARTMQRIDGLIAMSEPMLPLPERATPRAGVRIAGWAFAFAVVVTLVATMAVLVGSSRQTQVGSSDACGVLAAAARFADVVAASAKASAIKLPASLAGSWTACGYGDIATRSGPLVLFRSEPTAAWEVRALLDGLTSSDLGTQLHFGSFAPCSGDALTERWITVDGTCGSGTGPTIAVVADPYFFVVTAPSPDATRRLADAIVAELRRRPWPPLADASKIDACNVIARAAPSGGIPAPSERFPAMHHWAELYPSDPRMWSNTACAFRDESGHDQHLGIREVPPTLQQANDLLLLVSDSLAPSTVDDWVQVEAGMWLAHAHNSDCPRCVVLDYSAIAVLDEPHFFALTQATDEAAIQLARAVLAELKRP